MRSSSAASIPAATRVMAERREVTSRSARRHDALSSVSVSLW